MYTHGIRLRDLRVLARSQRNGGEDTVETYYGWRESRAMSVAKGFAGAAASVLTAWLIPFLKHEYRDATPWLIIVTPALLIVSLAAIGFVSVRRMDRIHASFVRAMVWLERLR
jgi:hypothetical protein